MIPDERSLVEALKDEPFALVGVNSDSDPDKLARLEAENGVTWPSFFDGGDTDGPIATRWGVRGWPTIYILDAKGVIRHTDLRGQAMAEAVRALLAELKAEKK